MKGIWYMDWLLLARSWFVLAVVASLVVAIFAIVKVPIGLISFFPIFLTIQACSLVFADRNSGWNRFAATLPFSRARLLKNKYQMAALCAIAGLGIGLSGAYLLAWLLGPEAALDAQSVLINVSIAMLISFSSAAILLPLAHVLKKHQEMVGAMISIAPSLLAVWWWQSRIQPLFENGQFIGVDMQQPLLNGLMVAAVLLFVASAWIMPGILEKRDLEK